MPSQNDMCASGCKRRKSSEEFHLPLEFASPSTMIAQRAFLRAAMKTNSGTEGLPIFGLGVLAGTIFLVCIAVATHADVEALVPEKLTPSDFATLWAGILGAALGGLSHGCWVTKLPGKPGFATKPPELRPKRPLPYRFCLTFNKSRTATTHIKYTPELGSSRRTITTSY